MTVSAWRILKSKHAATAFTGEGARRFGGRWNSSGTALVYTAGSPSLAVLELLVHLSSYGILRSYRLWEVTFDSSLLEEVRDTDLPRNWRSDPAPLKLKQIGDTWVAGGSSAVLRVPSAIVDVESNYLLNPAHTDFARIKIGRARRFRFDRRLIK